MITARDLVYGVYVEAPDNIDVFQVDFEPDTYALADGRGHAIVVATESGAYTWSEYDEADVPEKAHNTDGSDDPADVTRVLWQWVDAHPED